MNKRIEYLLGKVKPVIDFFLFSNFFVAFCFSCLAFQTFDVIRAEKDYSLLLFIFCSSFYVYSFHHWYGLPALNPGRELPERLTWFRKHRKSMVLACMLLAPVIIFSTFRLSATHIIALLPAGIISLGYTVPVIPGSGRGIGLREIRGLKIFIISFVISYVTVLLPAVSSEEMVIINDVGMILLFAGRFLFIFSITIPFDIRDMAYDKIRSTKTIPAMFGEGKAKIIAYVSLLCCAGITCMRFYLGEIGWPPLAAIFISLLVSAALISGASGKRSDYYFSFWMESMMLLQTILIFVAGRTGM